VVRTSQPGGKRKWFKAERNRKLANGAAKVPKGKGGTDGRRKKLPWRPMYRGLRIRPGDRS